MSRSRRSVVLLATFILVLLAAAATAPSAAHAQRGGAPRPEFVPEGYNDQQHMREQLGIKALRPGKSGGNQTGEGFDEVTSAKWLDTLPDLMTMKDGTKVTTPAQWEKRRAEIVEDFEREIYGRIPGNVPKVTWEVTNTTEGMSGEIPTVTKTLVGHVDNSAFPQITVDIAASFTVRKDATAPVPIMINFGSGGGGGFGGARRGAAARGVGAARGGAATAAQGDGAAARGDGPARGEGAEAVAQGDGPATRRGRGRGPGGGGGPSWTQIAISKGWAYGNINPGSIQADRGSDALRQGIIGLTNKGEPRKPEDWGSLRAWQWGVSRLINYFEANPDAKVDATKVGIEGVSRFGKAALVTGAFEPRLAVAFVASSGAGGAKLMKRDFGEAVENLTAGNEYHWMAGNYLKYAASDATFGSKNAGDLPVDAHQLIALCAPRFCFVTYGIESQGDPKWVDARGSYMAAILAGPAYRLLGKMDLGVTDDYRTASLPALDQVVGNELAWRQHSVAPGHSSAPNYPAFFEWIANYIKAPAVPQPASIDNN